MAKQPIDTAWHADFLAVYSRLLNIEQAAIEIGIKDQTFYDHQKRFPELKAAIKKIRRDSKRERMKAGVMGKVPSPRIEADEQLAIDEIVNHTPAHLRKVQALTPELKRALERAIHAPDRIQAEQARIKRQMADARDEIELAALEWRHDYIEKHTLRAAEAAQERLDYISQIQYGGDVEDEKARCEDDTLHWFKMYAWGIDPRSRGILKVVPFIPFDMQERFIRWIEETTFLQASSGVAEKSRDMGATEIFVRLCVKHFLFMPHFSALLISKGQDDVDNKKKQGTLFGRIRFQMRLLPLWQLPKGLSLDDDMTFMSLSNPENGAEITGKPPTRGVGRGDRTTLVLLDEFAHWPDGGYPQDTSLSETSPSLFKISSVNGLFNRFAEEAREKGTNLFVMDWREHPFKDSRWYNSLPYGYLQKKMRADQIAQEIDRNYEASQPGRVWPHFSPLHTVITMSEFRAFYQRHGIYVPGDADEDMDQQRVPLDWSTSRFNDRGATPGHRNAWLWAAGPREHHPLPDMVVCYREWLAPLGSTYTEIAEQVHEFEEEDGEDGARMVISQNSHEAQSERDNYSLEHDLELEGWQTDYEAGIAQVSEFLTVIDKDKPNPFRPHFDGKPIMGRTRLIILVANGQGEVFKRESGEIGVTDGANFLGMVNLRRQVIGYHYPPEEAGKPVGKMRPRKLDDDLVDDLRAAALAWDGLHAPESKDEKVKRRLKNANRRLDFDAIMRVEDEEERRSLLQSLNVHYQRMRATEKKPSGPFFARRYLDRARQDRQEAGTWAQMRRANRRPFR